MKGKARRFHVVMQVAEGIAEEFDFIYNPRKYAYPYSQAEANVKARLRNNEISQSVFTATERMA